MEKNTYPKIKDKIESMEKDSPSTFPRIFSTIAKSETKLGAWIYSNTRRTFLARPSNEISYRGWLISGLRTTFWHWVHARTHAHTGDKKEDSPSLPYRLPRIPRDH